MNTRDVIGDQATLDGLISGTLTEFVEDGIQIPVDYMFTNMPLLETLELPNLGGSKSIGTQFENLPKLDHFDFHNPFFGNLTFYNCDALQYIKILYESKVSDAFIHDSSYRRSNVRSPLKCPIYVPDSVFSEYKTNNYTWVPYRHKLFSLDDFPITSIATINESWETIVSSSSNGTYSTKYSIGDTALLSTNDFTILMMLIAKDRDVKSDGTGTAHMTWIACNTIPNQLKFCDSAASANWEDSNIRTYLIELLDSFPEALKNGIVEVKKYSNGRGASSSINCVTNDKLWIPSKNEIYQMNSSPENDECTYWDFYMGDNWASVRTVNRKYDIDGISRSYHTRSCYASGQNIFISQTGDIDTRNAWLINYDLLLGFCL